MYQSLGFLRIKVIALAVSDRQRAERFYGETLGLPPAFEGDLQVGYHLEQTILMLKDNWYGTPTAEPNPRITIASDHAPDTEAALRARGVTIADPGFVYDGHTYNSLSLIARKITGTQWSGPAFFGLKKRIAA